MARVPQWIAQQRHTLGQALAQHRKAAGLNQTELGKRTAYDRTSLVHIEAGRQYPGREFWVTADNECGAQGALIATFDKVDEAERQWRIEQLQFNQQPVEDDVNRRQLLALLGPVALGPAVADQLEQARRGIDHVIPLVPDGLDADEWERVAEDYARTVHVLPPAQTLPAITADFAELSDRIRAAGGTTRSRMVDSAARLATLTAITLVVMKEHLSAERWWRTASRAANAVDDPWLVTNVTGLRSVMSLYNSPADKVIDLAEQTVSLGKGKTYPGVVSGLAAYTQTMARAGREDEALQGLRRLLDAADRLADPGDIRSQWSWTEHHTRFVESEVHSYAGRVHEAFTAQDAAFTAYPDTSWQGPTQIQTHRAAVLIRSGDVDAGTRHLASTLRELQPWQRADGLISRSAMETLGMLPAKNLSHAHEVRALIGNTGTGV